MSGSVSSPVTVGCKVPNGLILRVGEAEAVISGSNSSTIIGGYGISSVPSDLWDAWFEKHKESSLVKNKIVFAQSTVAKANAQATELQAVKTGLEPLDPETPAPGITKADGK